MGQLSLLIVVAGLISGYLHGQPSAMYNYEAQVEFEPKLVDNPNRLVTFECNACSATELVESAGRQTRLPIGLVLRSREESAFDAKRSFHLVGVEAKSALLAATQVIGYGLIQKENVLLIVPNDLDREEQKLLEVPVVNFKTVPNSTMLELGLALNMWMQAAIDPQPGYNLSHAGSMNDERFTFANVPSATTEEIANRIVQLGSGGMWILRMNAAKATGIPIVTLNVQPYQHYSNKPVQSVG
jgi:hypothetical protein